MIQGYIKNHLPMRIVNYLRRFKGLFRSNTDIDFEKAAKEFLNVEPELRLISSILKPNDVCLDIGGNIGMFAYTLCKHCPEGKVLAFEPRYDLFVRIKKNLSQFQNFSAFNIALTDKNCTLTVSLDPSHGNSTVEETPNVVGLKKQPIQGQSLDNFLINKKIPKVDFIKIDVEGHEGKVLSGATHTISEHRPIILCESENRHLLNSDITVGKLLESITSTHHYKCFYVINDQVFSYNSAVVPENRDSKKPYIYNWFLVPEEKVPSISAFANH